MDTSTAVRRFDITGPSGVIGLHCSICEKVIIVNAKSYTGEPLYCDDCAEIVNHPDRRIPYRLHMVDLGYQQPVSA